MDIHLRLTSVSWQCVYLQSDSRYTWCTYIHTSGMLVAGGVCMHLLGVSCYTHVRWWHSSLLVAGGVRCTRMYPPSFRAIRCARSGVARIFPRRRPTFMGGPKVTPTKNWKVIGFGSLFFGGRGTNITNKKKIKITKISDLRGPS